MNVAITDFIPASEYHCLLLANDLSAQESVFNISDSAAYIPKIPQNASFGLLLSSSAPRSKIRNSAGYYSSLNVAQTKKSSRPKTRILRDLGYNIATFKEDNEKICRWFSQLAVLFQNWQHERARAWMPEMLAITGSRSFGASYTESDIECAIVSDNFDDFLQFCIFLNERYGATHQFEALKTRAGLPLLTIRKTDAYFDCPLLNSIYPGHVLPKVEVTFRHPAIHQKIQQAGAVFFNSLSDIAHDSYVLNKRFIHMGLKNPALDKVTFRDRPIKAILLELKATLMHHIMILSEGILQSVPDFDNAVLQQAIAHQIPDNLRHEAGYLLKVLLEQSPSPEQKRILTLIHQGYRLAPDDWALGQECFGVDTPWFKFFRNHRDQLTSQLKVNNRNYTAVPVITFYYQGEQYALLMKNPGLLHSSDVNEIEWTAHGVRVDAYEKSRLCNPELWAFFQAMSGDDEQMPFLLAAAWRRIAEMGIDLDWKYNLKIHPIDREAAGFSEENKAYWTSYFHFDLGERHPDELLARCNASTSSRYGHWTECFKIQDLIASVREVPHQTKKRESYQLDYKGEQLTVRMTTMRFILALNVMREVARNSAIQSPWDIRNPTTIERALTWIKNREDDCVQITLFSGLVNFIDSARIHACANKAGLNEENLASLSLKPERLVMHHLIAQLKVRANIKNEDDERITVERLEKHYFELFPNQCRLYFDKFPRIKNHLHELARRYPLDMIFPETELSPGDYSAWKRMKDLYGTLTNNTLSDTHKAIYYLSESDTDIAVLITALELYQPEVSALIARDVAFIVDKEIAEKRLVPMQTVLPDKQLFLAVTGPVASGKSVSEGLARRLLNGQDAAFVSSDSWNKTLVAVQNLGEFSNQCGKLTLAEAWFIKKIIWELLNSMAEANQVIHVIQEAMSPLSVRIPADAQSVVFINTASPDNAISRVMTRGDLSGRYVAGAETIGSYRWPWHNLLAVLEKKMASSARVQFIIIDSDISHACRLHTDEERERLSAIAVLKENTLQINNLPAFIAMVNRGYMINPLPRNAADVLLMSAPDLNCLFNEIKKLFQETLNLKVILNGQEVSCETLCELVTRVHTQNTGTSRLFQQPTPGGIKTMLTFEQWLERFSDENKGLLAFYGHWTMSPEERKTLTITGKDEYHAIRLSLYQLYSVLNEATVEQIKARLLEPDNSCGVDFKGIIEPKQSGLEANIRFMCQIRDAERKLPGESGDENLIKAFLLHDLGKCTAFVQTFNLAGDAPLAASRHDLYLEHWLADRPELRDLFNRLSNWVDVFDGLGYSPDKFAEPNYPTLLRVVFHHIKKLNELNELYPQKASENNQQVFNLYLYEKAKNLQLPLKSFAFLIDPKVNQKPWSTLDFGYQSKVVMLLWSSPFVFVKQPWTQPAASSEFIKLWQSGEHSEVVRQMTDFMIGNMESKDFILLYNITGLLHHNSVQGGSHIMYEGTVPELFTAFFPFILNLVAAEKKRIEEVNAEPTEHVLNKCQVLQAVEMPASMFSRFLDETPKIVSHQIDCAATSVKEQYKVALNEVKNRVKEAQEPVCSSSERPVGSSKGGLFGDTGKRSEREDIPAESKASRSYL